MYTVLDKYSETFAALAMTRNKRSVLLCVCREYQVFLVHYTRSKHAIVSHDQSHVYHDKQVTFKLYKFKLDLISIFITWTFGGHFFTGALVPSLCPSRDFCI